jgi:hypothetical protein
VTVVEKFDILTFMDADMSNYLKQHMKAKGVNVMTQTGLASVVRENGVNRLTLEDGTILRADAVLMCVGVRAESMLAKDAGLELTPNGAISVDAHMKTSDDSIYAVGDAVWVKNFVSGQHSPVPLAGPASKLARVAADNICGKTCTYDGVIATSVIKVFDLTDAATGLNESLLKRNNMVYAKCYVHPTNHAGYYPGADPISLKLLFDPKTEKIFGAQAVGTSGAEKRIDVLAAAIRSGMTVRDIAVLELCYAPPYGTSKDPVNAAGYVACNIIDGSNAVFEYGDIENIDPKRSFFWMCARRRNERACIPGSHHIPVDDLRGRIGELPHDKEIWVYCRAGLRGYVAARILSQHGFHVKNLNGGYRTYQAAVACAHTDYDPFWD